MDLETGRQGRYVRVWYALKRAWKRRTLVRNYLVFFVVLLLFVVSRTVFEEGVRVQTAFEERFRATDPRPAIEERERVPDTPDAIEERDPETCVSGDTTHLIQWDELGDFQSIRSDPARIARLEGMDSYEVPQLSPSRGTRGGVSRHTIERVLVKLRSAIATTEESCLAAIHVGVNARILVLESESMINPVVVSVSEDKHTMLESTAFHPDRLDTHTRPKSVRVRWTTVEDGVLEREFGGIDARCVLHLSDVIRPTST